MVARWLIGSGKRLAGAPGGMNARRRSVTELLLRTAGLCLFSIFGLAAAAGAAQLKLKQVTVQSFDRYVALTEDRMASEIRDPSGFLWMDRLPPARRETLLEQLRQGQVIIQSLETRDNGQPIPIPQGMVHHWLALVFVPGVTLAKTVAQQQEFGRSAQVYGPDILGCKVLQAKGNYFRVYYRLHRHVLIESPTYNADFDIQFVPMDDRHEYSWSHSTRIAEIVDPGMPNENEKPVGDDLGYLWRLNTYTRYEERDGGVYIQTEFLALSRSVPAIFAWLVNPYVKSIPQDYLVRLLGATRTDLMDARASAAREGAAKAAGTPEIPGGPVPAGRALTGAGAAPVNVKNY